MKAFFVIIMATVVPFFSLNLVMIADAASIDNCFEYEKFIPLDERGVILYSVDTKKEIKYVAFLSSATLVVVEGDDFSCQSWVERSGEGRKVTFGENKFFHSSPQEVLEEMNKLGAHFISQ